MQPEIRGARGAPTERLVGGVAALCEAIWPHGASDLAAEGVGKRVAALCDFWVTGKLILIGLPVSHSQIKTGVSWEGRVGPSEQGHDFFQAGDGFFELVDFFGRRGFFRYGFEVVPAPGGFAVGAVGAFHEGFAVAEAAFPGAEAILIGGLVGFGILDDRPADAGAVGELVAVFQFADIAQVEEDAIVVEEERCLRVDIEMVERLVLRILIVVLPRRLQGTENSGTASTSS